MHHGKSLRRLNRTSSHRRALLRNLVTALIKHERIETTLPKAKELRRVAERMITHAKNGSVNAKKAARGYLQELDITMPKLFGPLAKRFKDRPGGYTRIHKIGNRFGDCAPMAVIEYVDSGRDLAYEMTLRSLAHMGFAEAKNELVVQQELKNEVVVQQEQKIETSSKVHEILADKKVTKIFAARGVSLEDGTLIKDIQRHQEESKRKPKSRFDKYKTLTDAKDKKIQTIK